MFLLRPQWKDCQILPSDLHSLLFRSLVIEFPNHWKHFHFHSIELSLAFKSDDKKSNLSIRSSYWEFSVIWKNVRKILGRKIHPQKIGCWITFNEMFKMFFGGLFFSFVVKMFSCGTMGLSTQGSLHNKPQNINIEAGTVTLSSLDSNYYPVENHRKCNSTRSQFRSRDGTSVQVNLDVIV